MALTSWTNTLKKQEMYTVMIGSVIGPQVTEAEAERIMSIVNGIISQRGQAQGIQWAETAAPKAQKAETPKAEKKAKKDDFPALKLVEKIGFLSVYENCMVRQWIEGGYTPEKVRFGLKKAIQEAGGVWDEKAKAYKFAKKTDFNAFIKAQKAREHAK